MAEKCGDRFGTEGFDSRFCSRTPKQFGGSISVIFRRGVYVLQSIRRYDERGFSCVFAACIGER